MKIKQVVLAALLVAFVGNIPIAQAQPRPPYPIDRNQNSQIRKEFEDLLDRIADKADRFRKSFDRALDNSKLEGRDNPIGIPSDREDKLNETVGEFKSETHRIRDRFKDGERVRDDIKQMLSDGKKIDNIMRRLRLDRDAQNDWTALRSDLDRLEGMFGKFDRFDRPRR
ncbi:MAG: hypothetical protein U7123_15530 [Potamolinea sp.]